MLDLEPLRRGEKALKELSEGVRVADLRRWTNELVERVLAGIAGCEDPDVVFVPSDPEAHDPVAATQEEVAMAWTLGHVIVHITASAEESACLAAELARGVPFHGRSRREVPWQTVTTLAGCRQRLEESRRMRLASLDMWPDHPHLDNVYIPWEQIGEVNAVGRFLLGLKHDQDHLGQIEEIVRQARENRER